MIIIFSLVVCIFISEHLDSAWHMNVSVVEAVRYVIITSDANGMAFKSNIILIEDLIFSPAIRLMHFY